MRPVLKQLAVLGRGGFCKLAYTEWGSAKAKRTVICTHGVSRNGRDFDVLARALVESGARVVAPDLPGRGRSDWLTSPSHYTDRAYTSAMSTLIARLDVEEIDWIGTSLGGHVGMMLAAERSTPVRRLVLNDFGARVSAAALRRIGGYLTRSWSFSTQKAVEGHLREALAPFGVLSDEQWSHLAKHSTTEEPDGTLRFNYDPAIGARFSIPIWMDVVLWQLWDRIDCEVLILRGEHSDLLSADTVQTMQQRGVAARAGKVRAIEFANCGHAPALMDPRQIQPIVDFLAIRSPSPERITS
jgi:pimeloyl-ACP methyl ester carboxylesterase